VSSKLKLTIKADDKKQDRQLIQQAMKKIQKKTFKGGK